MEKSTASSTGSLIASATEDEIVVSLILLDLKQRISLSESLSGCNWGRRRRRSCLEVPLQSTSASSLPTPSPENRIEEIKSHIKDESLAAQEDKHGAGGAGRPTTSPDTPLNFSSDEKKSSKKRTSPKEDYLVMIEALTKNNVVLTGKIESLYANLKAFNSQLQAKKQEVLNLGGPNLGAVSSADRTVQEAQQHFFDPIAAHPAPSDDGLKPVNQAGPRGFDFDLNLVAEVYDERARSAEARRKRIGIIKGRRTRIGTIKAKSKGRHIN